MFKKLSVALFAGFLATSVWAGAIDDLNVFLKNTKSARGSFSQKVFTDKGEVKDQAAQGDFEFLRPGCFSWHYDAPFEEKMVSDGKTLWLYDVEMAQVTVKRLTAALPASPASILFGNNDFTRDFAVKELATQKGLHWLMAIPKDNASAFKSVKIAFSQQLPKEMILEDNFGQRTHLVFEDVKGNVNLKKSDFVFQVPKGVDVLEDATGF